MQIIIGLQILLTIWLIRYLLRRDTGPKEPPLALVYAGVLGVFAVVIGSLVELFIIPSTALPVPGQTAAHISVTTIALACLAVGVIEELAKAWPLKNFLYDKGYFNEVSDGIIYFGIAGMLFGTLENIGYALTYGSAVGFARLVTIPFMHAGFTSIIGYAIARRKVLGSPAGMVAAGFALAIGLHALYDFGQFYGTKYTRVMSLVITIAANLAVFYLYRRARQSDMARAGSIVHT
jgi:RsiW-degrading membrane proteinase PrsW (M82 family)